MILQNRWVTVDEVAHQLQIIRGLAYGLPSIKSVRDGSKSNSQNCTKRNSACPHTAVRTVEALKKLNFEVLEHPLYSLDLTHSDSPVWST
jgi:hypothetical protein